MANKTTNYPGKGLLSAGWNKMQEFGPEIMGLLNWPVSPEVDEAIRYYNGTLEGPLQSSQIDPQTGRMAVEAGFDSVSPMAMAAKVPGLLGMTAYHGSPHKFDRFDLSKIGTGEGAQAYGHGLYLAENPGVAHNYRKSLTERGGPEGTAAYMQRMYKDRALDYAKEQALNPNLTPEAKQFAEDVVKHLEAGNINQGHFYEVDLPDTEIEKMLDWDKPLNEQSWYPRGGIDAVVKGAKGRKPTLAEKAVSIAEHNPGITGKTFYKDLSSKLGSEAAASEYLKSHGFPGIKYFDGSSRSAGQGTRNFVIFDDSVAKILKRNDEPVGLLNGP